MYPAQCKYKGKVYSFEPRKEVYAVLSENLSINNCNNVVAFNIALSDSVTTLKVKSIDLNEKENFGSLSIDNDIFTLNSITYKINISTIDRLALGKVDFIKIDVEGMERQVLDGALETLFRDNSK
jgi:FkbM family methyltransferase